MTKIGVFVVCEMTPRLQHIQHLSKHFRENIINQNIHYVVIHDHCKVEHTKQSILVLMIHEKIHRFTLIYLKS